MKSSVRSTRRCGRWLNRRGASLVEMAVIMPVAFLLIFSIVEFSRMVMVQQAVANAARHGCRKACLKSTTSRSQVEDAVRSFLQATVPAASDPEKVRVDVDPEPSKSTPAGTDLVVRVDVDFSDVTWLPGDVLGLGDGLVLRAAGNMERE